MWMQICAGAWMQRFAGFCFGTCAPLAVVAAWKQQAKWCNWTCRQTFVSKCTCCCSGELIIRLHMLGVHMGGTHQTKQVASLRCSHVHAVWLMLCAFSLALHAYPVCFPGKWTARSCTWSPACL